MLYITNYNTKAPFRMTPLTVGVPDMSQFTQDYGSFALEPTLSRISGLRR